MTAATSTLKFFGMTLVASLLAGCSAGEPPAAWRRACLAYNPGRDQIVPIGGYPLSVLDQGWRDRGGGLSEDHDGVLVLHARAPLTGKTMVVRMQTELVPDAARSDQCGPAALVVRGLSVDGEVQDSIALEQALSVLTTAAAGFLKLPTPVIQDTASGPPPKPAGAQALPAPPTIALAPPAAPAAAPPAPAVTPAAPAAAWSPPLSTANSREADAQFTPDYRRCMTSGDAAGGVTSAMQDCTGEENARQDQRLNAAYQAAMRPLAPAQQTALRASERGWLAARKQRCDGAAAEEAGGTLSAVLYSRCMLQETATRAAWLEQYRP